MVSSREAMYYDKLENSVVECKLCPHECKIPQGGMGLCRARSNVEGKLYSRVYGRASAIAMDPMEKKPLYHYYPGRYILSLGTVGCNFRCSFCQNYHIAQLESQTREVTKEHILELCEDEPDCVGVAFTYNEPSIWYEFILETAQYMKQRDYVNVLVTNGYISEKPLLELLPHIGAMNIDVKGFTEKYYREICGGSLEHVKNTVEAAARRTHVEITTLVVPGYNDSEQEMRELAAWLSSISPSIPLHLSRYFPMYKMKEAPTPIETIKKLRDIAREYLEYVYVGNVQGEDQSTYCPECKALLLSRERALYVDNLRDGVCTRCGKRINIIGE